VIKHGKGKKNTSKEKGQVEKYRKQDEYVLPVKRRVNGSRKFRLLGH